MNIIPRVLGEMGNLVIHASSVLTGGGSTVLFVGASGAGKSTLAASFACDDGALLSDDSVLLRSAGGDLVAFEGAARARLWDDSFDRLIGDRRNAALSVRSDRGAKWTYEMRPERAASPGRPVGAIFDLSVSESDDAIVIEEIPGAKLVSMLIDRAFLFDGGRESTRAFRFVEASEAARRCPLSYAIRYPRSFDRLADVRRAIVDRISADAIASHRSIAS
jgi:hypothetical protein